MKKKIILVLSFLMIAMCLTGCSVIITSEEVDKVTQMVQDIKDNPDYQLPENATIQYADPRKADRIILLTEKTKYIFNVSKDTPKLIQIEKEYSDTVSEFISPIIITSEKIDKATKMAQAIKDNPNYLLPEDVAIKYADPRKTDRIIISIGEKNCMFDISEDTIKLIQIEKEYNDAVSNVIASIILVIMVLIGYVIINHIDVKDKKYLNEINNEYLKHLNYLKNL